MENRYTFEYCQKMVIFSKDLQSVLLCQRQGEQDYDGTFTFPGGKMETTDSDLVAGLQREKDEELGSGFRVFLYPSFSHNILFKKKSGKMMVIPHYPCVHHSGEIHLSEEYAAYKWVKLSELEAFEPKIANIPAAVNLMKQLLEIAQEDESILL